MKYKVSVCKSVIYRTLTIEAENVKEAIEEAEMICMDDGVDILDVNWDCDVERGE